MVDKLLVVLKAIEKSEITISNYYSTPKPELFEIHIAFEVDKIDKLLKLVNKQLN